LYLQIFMEVWTGLVSMRDQDFLQVVLYAVVALSTLADITSFRYILRTKNEAFIII